MTDWDYKSQLLGIVRDSIMHCLLFLRRIG
jgi:hypothetical protein